MHNNYKVIISNHNLYHEIELPNEAESYRVGTTIDCDFRLHKELFFEDVKLEFVNNQGEWSVMCSDNTYITKGDIRRLLTIGLHHGDSIGVKYQSSSFEVFNMDFMVNFDTQKAAFYRKIDFSNTDRISIGSADDNDIILFSKYTINNKIEFWKKDDGLKLVIKSATYGVYHNGNKAIDNEIIKNGDFISISDYRFCYKDDALWTEISDGYRISNISYADYIEEKNYPMFIRNTRIKSQCDKTSIKILDPSAIPTEPEINLLTSLMPAIVMLILVVVLRGIMSTSTGSYVLFSICSMGLGVITSIINIFDKKKKYKTECANRISTYEAYIKNKKEEIEQARDEELQCLRKQYYNKEENLEHINTFSSFLFDRTPEDEDFLDVYLGVGAAAALREIEYKQQEKLEIGDELSQIPNEISKEFMYVENAPIVMGLKDANAVGVVGESEQLYEMMKCILLDVISRQYYGDVNIYALLGEDYEKYEWLRLLPHLQKSGRQRNIVHDNESKNYIFENLYKELTSYNGKQRNKEFNIVFVMEEHGIKSHPISKFIEKASEINTVFIFFEKQKSLLPLHCSKIIEIFNNKEGTVFDADNEIIRRDFQYTTVSDEKIKEAVKMLAPVFCEEISLESSLKKSISLFELLGIYSTEDINLKKNWLKSKIYDSMAVPLGVNVKDEVVYLNLHEKYHGPHGLVAGTTGSGKSEILQTYILGAATLFHPYEIGFVIIDFKGGGMVNQFKDLPHLIGAITNIDEKAIDRSLKSIKAELLKRQSLFAAAEVNHIDKYIKAYQDGKVEIALPHLVIIVDEFAELKAEQPEFMKELISAARIGRSLGVHLILATQKPAGQVNEQIWSNSKFKLCLKVQTQEDSNEVLKSPLAAEIREPGRAYLQVGNNEVFELLQSGFSGSAEKSDNSDQKSFDIIELDFKGSRKLVYRQKPQKAESSRTQLEAVVEYTNNYCVKNKVTPLSKICLPALEEVITSDIDKCICEKSNEMNIIVGIYDDPDHQYQGNAKISLGTTNTLIIGSSQYGKTNLIEVILKNLTESYTSEELNIYILDFASMVLKNFEKLEHVGGVVCPSDDEKLKNLFKFLHDQIVYRREKLLAVGVSSFVSYKESGRKDIPQIVVFIDNMTALKELYLQDNDALLNLCREGNSVGISFVIANAQTSGLGFKYLANFATRLTLFCNESSEYTSVFGACKLRPDEVPGRCLIEVEKTLYECQTFLAFEGEREIDRVKNMQEWIHHINHKNVTSNAVLIPEIPELLGEQYVLDFFTKGLDQNKQVIGLSYETVMPVMIDMIKANMLALSGPDDSGKSNFIKYLMHAMDRRKCEMDVFIFDDYRKKLFSLENQIDNVYYEIGTNNCKETLINIDLYLQNEYQSLISGNSAKEEWKVLIFNNEEVIKAISEDKASIEIIKNIIGRYKMFHVFILWGCVPNAQIVYGVPEVYKLVKESKNIMFFDNLENCKLVDVPLSIVRKNKKKIEVGDTYYINGNDCYKVKVPLAVH